MTSIVDEAGLQIARRLRLEREARGWSQAQLAAQSGVSKATISKVERGEMSPTAVTLVRLAGAFDLTLAGLLTRAEAPGGRLTRAADQPRWQDPASGYRRRQISMRPDHPLELVQIELPAQQQVQLPAASYAQIQQLIWVQSGELRVTEGAETQQLAPGDCLAFGPPSDTTLANDTESPCTYLVLLVRR
jgi:transcriptional regulator with XRE-family HTH domain